jgi:hypothetical protein
MGPLLSCGFDGFWQFYAKGGKKSKRRKRREK